MTHHQQEFLLQTYFFDFDHPAVKKFTDLHSKFSVNERETVVALYYAVRDGIRYDPYRIDLSDHGMRASTTLQLGYGWCISKAVLLVACCRSLGIKARLGFADVKNHLTSKRLQEKMQTDVFLWHGYTEIFLEGQWVKATPAFNKKLCEKANILPLDFNGRDDSIFHPFDREGNQHMEYLNHRGSYADLPLTNIRESLQQHCQGLFEEVEEKGEFITEILKQ